MENRLVSQLKKGDEEAFRYLYNHHYVSLCHVAYEYLHDHFLAETVVSDTIFHLWEIRESLEITVSIRAYLVRAVRNRCLNYLELEREKREVTFRKLILKDSEELYFDKFFQTSVDTPMGGLLEKELEMEIQKAIQKLAPECRAVFEKSRFEENTYEEISKELGISINTVKYHIKSALSILRKELDDYLSCF